MYIESHPRRLSSFCTVRPAFAPQRLDLRTFRRSDVLFRPSPAPTSGPQVLLFSKFKAPINHVESTLLQVFFLKNLKPFAITTFRETGEGVVIMVNHLLETSHPFFLRSATPCLCGCPVFHSPYTLPSSVSRKSFVCHSYENTGGVGVLFPFWARYSIGDSTPTGGSRRFDLWAYRDVPAHP